MPSLIEDFDQWPPGDGDRDGRVVEGAWTRTRFDVILAPSEDRA
jgi:hydroxyquinol 1,2-dioxygenase